MEAHNGEISVCSNGEGHGTTFTISLPLVLNADKNIIAAQENTSSRRAAPMDVSVEICDESPCKTLGTILVVDDSYLTRKMLVRTFKAHFDTVLEAADGAQALEIVREALRTGADIGTIISDYQMPVMDGPTSVKAMRGLGYNGIIVGLTGNASQSDVNTFVLHGANKVYTKPLNVASFFLYVGRHVELRPQLRRDPLDNEKDNEE